MYIYLDFVEGFACAMCGKCCRNDWMVTIDADAYNRNYQLFHMTGNNSEFDMAFIPLGSKMRPDEYAYIAKQPDGACWFLETDNRCRLHRQAGHSHLDSVCQTFPRYPMNTSRGIELTLSFSCPAVLEIASREKPVTVVRADTPPLEVDEKSCVAEVFPRQKPGSSVLRYYFELEQHFIDIMQCRAMTLKERLDILTQTAGILEMSPEGSSVSRQLEQVFSRNYSLMDNRAEIAAGVNESYSRADALIENFFVNLIFKKTFYLHGLAGSAAIFRRIWHEITPAPHSLRDEKDRYRYTAAAVANIEFKYGHDRGAFLAAGSERGSA